MSDTVSKQKRTQIMAAVKNKDTKDEIIVRKFLYRNGFRYRKNVNKFTRATRYSIK